MEKMIKINPTAHLCRSRVKQTALEIAKSRINGFGAPRFKRVGQSFLQRIEAKVRAAIAEEIRIHPSRGQTLL